MSKFRDELLRRVFMACLDEGERWHRRRDQALPKQRVCVHVNVKNFGRARAKEQIGTCSVRREGDSFFFNIAEQVIIEPR